MKINESLLCPQLQTTDERQQDVNNIMILSRKKMTRKLTPKPSLLCQRSIHVDNRNIPTCTTNEIQYTKGTSWGSIFNRKSITISPTTNKKAAFTKRRSGLVRRTHSPVNMVSQIRVKRMKLAFGVYSIFIIERTTRFTTKISFLQKKLISFFLVFVCWGWIVEVGVVVRSYG